MKTCFFTFLFFLVFLPSCQATRIDGPYEGKVIDADTGKPIEGVVVLGTWSRETPTVAGAVHHYYDAMETVTDKNGEFKIQGLGLLVFSDVLPMDVLIFKAGYEYLDSPWESLKKSKYLIEKKKIRWEGNRATVPLRKLTMEERRSQGIPDIYLEERTEEGITHLYIPKKIKLLIKEANKESIEQGLKPLEGD